MARQPLGRLRSHLEQRLEGMPRYRQRLSKPTTGGLSWPDWEPAEEFDLAGHVRRARLPGRGSDADLLEWAGEFFSERLDRTRPLWELVLVDGLEDGALGARLEDTPLHGRRRRLGRRRAGDPRPRARARRAHPPRQPEPSGEEPPNGTRAGGRRPARLPLPARSGPGMLRGTFATAAPRPSRDGAREI